ncbi:MAG: kinase/pyrophosphorylase [Anaerolineae bacterium]|nr:kinase/pyrophosphorylase [Anaerolineae bacterium]
MAAAPIYIVSGGEGNSGQQVLHTALAQFGDVDVPITVRARVHDPVELETIVQEAHQQGALIVHTLVNSDLRQRLLTLTNAYHVSQTDLMGALLEQLATHLACEPLEQPGLYRQLRLSYFERIEAIEFTVAHDDGRRPHELALAEIVLTGISRVGKTPLAIYLSVQGWKTANVPLVAGIDPPPELFDVDPRRVIGLTIDPAQLLSHRQWRQKHLKLGGSSDYVDLAAIIEHEEAARRIFRRGGFSVIDITGRPIEESAADIIDLMTRRLR